LTNSLVTANILSRPTRTVISILAVGTGVILMLIIGGITTGTLNDYINRTMGMGADFILQPSGSSVLYAFSSAALPIKLADKLREMPGVGAVAPVLAKFSSSDFGLVFGIDLASYDRFPGRLDIIEGRSSLQDDEAIVDDLYAKSHKVAPGMTIEILGRKFTISGICRRGSVVRVFVPLERLQKMNGTEDKVTIMFIKAAPGANVETVFQNLRRTYPGLALVRTSDPSMLLADTRMPGLREFRMTVVTVSMLISFMVILLAMYTTIFERTREIGILKSMGASKTFIVGLILRESVMISVLGIFFGVATSLVIRKLITSAFPTLQVDMTLFEVLRCSLLGLLGGTLGALYPAYKAARMDPVQALSYE
jgi:putative ABC transport system permease protein